MVKIPSPTALYYCPYMLSYSCTFKHSKIHIFCIVECLDSEVDYSYVDFNMYRYILISMPIEGEKKYNNAASFSAIWENVGFIVCKNHVRRQLDIA